MVANLIIHYFLSPAFDFFLGVDMTLRKQTPSSNPKSVDAK